MVTIEVEHLTKLFHVCWVVTIERRFTTCWVVTIERRFSTCWVVTIERFSPSCFLRVVAWRVGAWLVAVAALILSNFDINVHFYY